MYFLIDSNVAFKSDPLAREVEDDFDLAMRFHQLVSDAGHGVLVHPATLHDVARDTDTTRRALRERSLRRYPVLEDPPAKSAEQIALLGTPIPRSNDDVDQDILAAVVGDAVAFLVTQDDGLHRRAARLGVEERVLRLPDAIAFLEGLYVQLPAPPPAVERRKAYQLDLRDPIWDSLRQDYAGFNTWLARARQEQRDALVISREGRELAAVCLLKQEPAGEYGIPGPLLKISTLKVGTRYSGHKYGELLLKAIFDQCGAEDYAGIYVTVFDRHAELLAVLADFGFRTHAVRTALGELILYKQLRWSTEDEQTLDPLTFHITFGPPAIKIAGACPHLVPIEPRWHRLLFPDAEPAHLDAETLFPATEALETHPFGNALRKAYLCHASTRRLGPGDPLLFYRSHDERAVFVVGVCESVTRSENADEIATLVGNRTVYTYGQIQAQVRSRQVLAVLFRQARVLRSDPITLDDLQRAHAVQGPPQTIQRVREEGIEWLRQRLAA